MTNDQHPPQQHPGEDPRYQMAHNAQQQLQQGQQYSGATYGYPQQVKPRSPALGAIASFFVPGLGQLATGRAGMGVLMFSLFVVSLILMFAVVGFITAPLVWLWSMIDGYHGAKKWNTRHGIAS